jgi:hypothetical protein
MAQPGGDLERYAPANEEFAMAGRRDRAGRVVRIGAGADNGAVADPPGGLAGPSAGRGGGRQIAATITGDGADSIAAARLLTRAFERMPQLAPALFGVKIAGLGKSNASFPTKASVPSPISRTWRPRSSTARAAKTGLRGPKMPATAPARFVAPPSRTHPFPAFRRQ